MSDKRIFGSNDLPFLTSTAEIHLRPGFDAKPIGLMGSRHLSLITCHF
jgi:hypothetical protein